MDAKEPIGTAQEARNDESRDSASSRHSHPESNDEAKKQGDVPAKDTTPATETAPLATIQGTHNSGETTRASSGETVVKTVSDEASHKMMLDDNADVNAKIPDLNAGNNQVTVHPSQQSLAQSAAARKTPVAPSVAAKTPTTETDPSTKPESTSVAVADTLSISVAATPASLDTLQAETSIPKQAPEAGFPFRAIQQGIDPLSIDDTLQRLRAPLTETYSPHIDASDTSLTDARLRLRKALDQTRHLRQAFTDRVYKKYRVILRPVPKSVDAIIDPIVADPVSVSRKLQEQIRQIKEEKEIEKRETQKLAAAKPLLGPDGAPLLNAGVSAAETAEQLAFVTSGLSLVILPEDEVDASEIDISKFEYRGPTNYETGQRVSGISAAAATAAELLLDRVRRSSAMRVERQRRRQLQLLAGETETDTASNIMFPSSMHLMSSTDSARRISPTSASATKGQKVSKTIPPFPSSAAKSSRTRMSASMSGSALLTLNPSSEELKTDGKPSAATAALLSRGVGAPHAQQQRWQHPHPESLGALANSMLGSSTRMHTSPASTIPEYLAKRLPPFPKPRLFRESQPVKVIGASSAETDRARTAVQLALEPFLPVGGPSITSKQIENGTIVNTPDQISAGNDASVEPGATDAMETDRQGKSSKNTRKKRCATEIDLLHSLQYAPAQDVKLHQENPGIETKDAPDKAAADSHENSVPGRSLEYVKVSPPIQPMLAFSVIHALGLVREAERETMQQDVSPLSLIDTSIFLEGSRAESDENAQPELSLKDLMTSISCRKRLFSDLFLSSRVSNGTKSKSGDKPPSRPSGVDPDDGESEKSVTKRPRKEQTDEGDGQDSKTGSETRKDCPVISIRGGGEDTDDRPGDGTRLDEESHSRARGASHQKRTDTMEQATSPVVRPASGSPMSPSRQAFLHNHAMLAELTQQQQPLSLLHHPNASDVLYTSDFSPPRTSASSALSNERNDALHRHSNLQTSQSRALQALQLAHARQGHQLAGDLSDYYGVQRHSTGYGSHTDWSSLSSASAAAAAGLLPTHSSLASLGLTPHHAAVVSLSVQDRARELLAREQQNAAAAAHAASGLRRAGMAEYSQAAVFMGGSLGRSQSDSYVYSGAPSSRLSQLGGYSESSRGLPGVAAALDQSPTRRRHKSKKLPTDTTNSDHRSSPTKEKVSSTSSPGRRSKMKGESGVVSGEGANDQYSTSRDENHRNRKPDLQGSRKDDSRDGNHEAAADARGNPGKAVCEETPSAPCKDASRAGDTASSLSGANSAEESSRTSLPAFGMQFVLPDAPAELPVDVASLIVDARIHIALGQDNISSREKSLMIQYMLAVGGAVPIPKALISSPLKERLNTPGFKSHQSNTSTPPVPREVVIAAILVWLWGNNKTSFQRAFAKSGRIDVDPECRWLIQTAVDASVRALMIDIADTVARSGPSAPSLGSGQTKDAAKTVERPSSTEEDRSNSTTSVDTHVALIVSQALTAEFCIDDGMDAALPCFDDLVRVLDECRLCALRTKCRERVFLAALVSRSTTMSEQFSHAYVSAMVRAGEAIGYEELFEQVQDEDTLSSTMMPYDIFTDESGPWEDPCHTNSGFAPNLAGDELMRRAHARAMIQKSLKKLQDRHSIRGGTATAGPYADPPPAATGAGPAVGAGERPQIQRTLSGLLRRKSSISVASESNFDYGSGVTVATNAALFNPRHYSAPLFWDIDDLENQPYGRYTKGFRQRSFSVGRLSFGGSADETDSNQRSRKRPRFSRSGSISVSPRTDDDNGPFPRSTHEIAWVDVAQIFQPVELAGPTTPTIRQATDEASATADKTIIAPFCRKVENPPPISDEEAEEEDISDAAILARHKVVLDEMKQKLDKVMEARQQALQRGRPRSTVGR